MDIRSSLNENPLNTFRQTRNERNAGQLLAIRGFISIRDMPLLIKASQILATVAIGREDISQMPLLVSPGLLVGANLVRSHFQTSH